MNPQDYPFRCVLSFKPLIDYAQRNVSSWGETGVSFMERLNKMLEQAPEFHAPIEDLSLLSRHRELVRSLVSLVLPPASWESDPVAVLVPFVLKPVFVSPSFRRLLIDEHGQVKGAAAVGEEHFLRGRILRAYYLILEKYYGIRQKFDYPVVRVVPDPETGLDLYLRIKPNLNFVEVIPKSEVKQLSDRERSKLLEHLADPGVLREILPPENFEIHGLAVFNVIDVTHSEILTGLEKDLIDQESIFSMAGFLRLQERLRILFRSPDVVVGLAAIHEGHVMLLNLGCQVACGSVFSDSRHIPVSEFKGSLYERAIEENTILRIRDLREESLSSQTDEVMRASGVRSLMIAPLTYKGETIGTLDIESPNPDEFGPIDIALMNDIAPIFSLAINRAIEEIDHSVQSIIKEKCTAVHPAVEWRFRKAAFQHLDRLRMGQPSDLEAIVFRGVYPLYGVSDIRGSSIARNQAIKDDLEEHLRHALQIVDLAGRARPLTVLEELRHRLRVERERINAGLGSSGEAAVVGLLKREVEPLFPHLRSFGPDVLRAIDDYEKILDPKLGSVYRRRKEFEESVSLLSQRVSFYLDREEAEAQSVFPHYFEKHQTDGVDYLVYVGASLVEDGYFNEIYLENFRLWQIMVACGIGWLTEELKKELAVPLDMAHLILVSRSPLSIRFRFDEKRFDVDGAYDIRHEIVKSRIDKALVRGSGERLTQPGKIAVVYSQPLEGREARRHMQFLGSSGYLKGDLESLDVEELPGVHGLKALRMGIDLESTVLPDRVRRMID